MEENAYQLMEELENKKTIQEFVSFKEKIDRSSLREPIKYLIIRNIQKRVGEVFHDTIEQGKKLPGNESVMYLESAGAFLVLAGGAYILKCFVGSKQWLLTLCNFGFKACLVFVAIMFIAGIFSAIRWIFLPKRKKQYVKDFSLIKRKDLYYNPCDFYLPDSDILYLQKADIEQMSIDDVYNARLEIFARHGAKYEENELRRLFEGKSWYDYRKARKVSTRDFNKYEIANYNLLVVKEGRPEIQIKK